MSNSSWFKCLSRLFLLLSFGHLIGCMSLPKPPDKNIEELKPLMQRVNEQINAKQTDQAIATLDEARKKVTDDDKLKNGQGHYFKNEAQLVAVMGHLEFERTNLIAASEKWKESFDIEYRGSNAQYQVDAKNAKIQDVIVTVLSGVIAGLGAKPGTTYTYPVQTTVLPTPSMMKAGIPSGTVLRFPARVERPPFSNIVKFKGVNNYCTASMITPRISITAAHCMSTGLAVKPELMSIQQLGIFPSKQIKVERFYTHMGENAGWDGQRRNDWLILFTDIGIGNTSDYSKVLKDIPATLAAGTDKLMLAGYSSDLNQGTYLTLHYGCTVKKGQNLKGGIYFTNCENAKGSSGAPVMTVAPPYYIVGIHTAQITDPKDDFYSVETFSNDFLNTLEKVAGPSVIAGSSLTSLQTSLEPIKQNKPQVYDANKVAKFLKIRSISQNGVTKESFIDPDSITSNQNNIEVKVIGNFPVRRNSKDLAYQSDMNKLEIDCNNNKYRFTEGGYYPQDYANGIPIESYNFIALGMSKWLDVTTNSQIEDIKTIACKYPINRVQAKPINNIAVNPIPEKPKYSPITPKNDGTLETKLIALKSRLDKGEINQKEYEKQKLVILNSL